MTEPKHHLAVASQQPAPRDGLPNLAAFLEPDRLIKQHGEAITAFIFAMISQDQASHWRHARTGPERSKAIQVMLENGPLANVIEKVAGALSDALSTKPSRKVALAAVGALLDARARLPHKPEIYFDALVFDLFDEGFPPAVVVAACQRIRREQVFIPEIAEVLAVCREILKGYKSSLSIAERALKERGSAERILIELQSANQS